MNKKLKNRDSDQPQDPIKVETNLMDLNDECLREIVLWLPLDDLLRTQRVNSRLRRMCLEKWSAMRTLTFSSTWNLLFGNGFKKSPEIVFEVIKWCGVRLLFLEVTKEMDTPDEGLIAQICRDCPNVKFLSYGDEDFLTGKLICRDDRVNKPTAFPIVENVIFANITDLRLFKVEVCLKTVFSAFPVLEKLCCSAVNPVSDDFPKQNLRKLVVQGQYFDQEMLIQKVAPKLANLETFLMTSMIYEDEGDFDEWYLGLVEYFSNPRLTELGMFNWYMFEEEFYNLGMSIRGQLEIFHYDCVAELGLDGFERFLSTQPNLKIVSLVDMPSDHVPEVIAILEEYAETRGNNETLNIYVNDNIEVSSPVLNIIHAKTVDFDR